MKVHANKCLLVVTAISLFVCQSVHCVSSEFDPTQFWDEAILSSSYFSANGELKEAFRLSLFEKVYIWSEHIRLRSETNLFAANMKWMKWNEEIANLTYFWAQKCNNWPVATKPLTQFNGSRLYLASHAYGLHTSRAEALKKAIQEWETGKNIIDYYKYPVCGAGDGYNQCGDYANIVYSEATAVGCAMAQCSDCNHTRNGENKVWPVCQYVFCAYPERPRSSKPFEMGRTCSKCDSNSSCCILEKKSCSTRVESFCDTSSGIPKQVAARFEVPFVPPLLDRDFDPSIPGNYKFGIDEATGIFGKPPTRLGLVALCLWIWQLDLVFSFFKI